ncbi:hypothetical protein DYI25_10600 [Mesobacillus boroniphilus]|uniref:YqgU-like 6-bladed beta-propeller domain-containing protein n=1 Tax=Mesobacillus boroniphilus TaxID=308892 RepID=A0A944CL80_9BACI|nr:hypothetical protein [Mesobacillus boroniphilus]MBS8264889.1 hypothetical protein [Mesobacillus boroniphilus]
MRHINDSTYRIPYVIWLLLIIVTSAFGLSGCSQELDGSLHEGADHSLNRIKEAPGPSFLGAEIIPIEIGEQEEFYKSSGWLSDSEILYVSNKGENSSFLYSYNLGTGKETLLYRSANPIITAVPSPEKTKVLIHSAASEEGILTIIDLSGKELYSTSIQSYELTFEWNPFDENLLVISAFTDEWDFSSYLLDLRENNLEELNLPEPFVRWISESMLVYQEWDEDGISLKAPLRSVSLKGNKAEILLEEVYQFDSIGSYLMTVKVNEEENQELGLYTFFRDGDKSIATITAPLLTSFSGWVVPFYDLMENGKGFIYLQATEQGEADIYDGTFNLMRYHLDTSKEEVLFTEMANEPLSCSPSGGMCLYGFQFEKILNIETNEIIDLVH